MAAPSRRPRYQSELRTEQANQTRLRIEQAAYALFETAGDVASVTFKAVAQAAGVTEITVYRHFPSRDALLQGLWRQINARIGSEIGMPETLEALLDQNPRLLAGFDRVAAQIEASIYTPQGRNMRASLNEPRRRAFSNIVREINPRLSPAQRTRAAAVLQLLHSAYAWASLREQWGMDGHEAARTTQWAIEALIRQLRSDHK